MIGARHNVCVGYVNRRSLSIAACAALLLLALSACTITKVHQSTGTMEAPPSDARVLLLPPNVQLFELAASGLLEPKAAWTETAKVNVQAALDSQLQEKNLSIVRYEPPQEDTPDAHTFQQMEKLHEAVGQSILIHKYSGETIALPTKKDTFDWTLGPDVRILARDSGASYALFVYMRDSFSSGGRVALQLMAALIGVGLPGGQQLGFASLVDLHTGDVVWFNRLVSTVGDLRKDESAHAAVENLLSEIPL